MNVPAPPLLLLPGLLCDHALWTASIAALRAMADVPEIAFGDLSQQRSIVDMAEAVLAVAPARFCLAGFSMGGQVAMEICRRAPDRVSRLALLSTNSQGLSPVVRSHLADAIERVHAEGLDGYLADAFPLYFSETGQGDAQAQSWYVGMAQRLGATVATRQMKALLEYPGFDPRLSAIGCPTTLICGALDLRCSPALHASMAAQISGATLRVIERSAHFTPLEAPGDVGAALRDWLQAP